MKRRLFSLGLFPSAILISSFCSSCTSRGSLETKYNAYAEQNQSDFFNDLTCCYHDYYNCLDLYCHSEAEAVLMGTYDPGFTIGGTYLHQGLEDKMETMPEESANIYIPSKFAPREVDARIERYGLAFRPKDYKFLDRAMSHSTAGKIDGHNVVVYHGYEYNEYELMQSINSILGVDNILTIEPRVSSKISLTPLKNQILEDYCWCATTMSKDFALDWANNNTETEDGQTLYNVPVYEMNLDPDVNCAYVSYSNKKWFDGIYLAWPHEYQLLTERHLKFEISDAQGIPRPNKLGNYLYLKCNVHRKK